jgi:hypothetical protein
MLITMRRRVFQIAVVLSLLLCIASGALWARSYTLVHAFQLREGTWLEKDLFRERVISTTFGFGSFWMSVRSEDMHLDHPHELFGGRMGPMERRFRAANANGEFRVIHASQPIIPRRRSTLNRDGRFQIHWSHDVKPALDTIWASVLFPAWLLPIFFAILPGIAIARRLKHRRCIRNNFCTNCGYDLRASSDRCPECGSIISAPESPQSLVRPVDAVADQ